MQWSVKEKTLSTIYCPSPKMTPLTYYKRNWWSVRRDTVLQIWNKNKSRAKLYIIKIINIIFSILCSILMPSTLLLEAWKLQYQFKEYDMITNAIEYCLHQKISKEIFRTVKLLSNFLCSSWLQHLSTRQCRPTPRRIGWMIISTPNTHYTLISFVL